MLANGRLSEVNTTFTSIVNSLRDALSNIASFMSPRRRRVLWLIFAWIVCPLLQSMVIYYIAEAKGAKTHFNVERLINCHHKKINIISFNTTTTGPVDGKWGKWSNWSECSSKYSYGTQIRYRFCDSPTPKYSGRYCEVGARCDNNELGRAALGSFTNDVNLF